MKDYHEMAESLLQRRDHYIAERKRKMSTLIKTTTGLSCVCLAILSGMLILKDDARPGEAITDISPVTIENTMADRQDPSVNTPDTDGHAKESSSERYHQPESLNSPKDSTGTDDQTQNLPEGAGSPDTPAPGIEDAEKYIANTESDSSPQGENAGNLSPDVPDSESGSGSLTPDVPVSELSPGSFQSLTMTGSYTDFFGGSYTNNQGLLCILLTEDSPENRSAVCRELGLNESSVIFQSADFTLAYLTELQSKISEKMVSRELSFITVSSLREDTNRIHLTVTTEDESLLAGLYALDCLGGALEVKYSDGSPIKILTEPKAP